jgi:hypothetical protein
MNMTGLTLITASTMLPGKRVIVSGPNNGLPDGAVSGDAVTVSPERFVSGALDEAIAALAVLDADRLEEITANVTAVLAGRPAIEAAERMAASRGAREEDLREVLARQRLLGHLLESTSVNLNVLQGLRRRNGIGGDLWVR